RGARERRGRLRSRGGRRLALGGEDAGELEEDGAEDPRVRAARDEDERRAARRFEAHALGRVRRAELAPAELARERRPELAHARLREQETERAQAAPRLPPQAEPEEAED